MIKFIKKFRKLKLKPNTTTFVDLIVIVLLFVLFSSYFKMTRPQNEVVEKDDFVYKLSTSNYQLNKNNGILIINVLIENKDKKNREIEIYQENVLNIIIEKNGEIYYKKDIMERKLPEPRILEMGSFKKLYLSHEWYIKSNTDLIIEPGKYNLIAQLRDFNIVLKLPIVIE